MLKHRNHIPLDYSLCQDTVTVYHREGLTRHILRGVQYEQGARRTEEVGKPWNTQGFLLIVPGAFSLETGDRIAWGEAPEIAQWADTAGLPTVESVRQYRFRGQICHTEARG